MKLAMQNPQLNWLHDNHFVETRQMNKATLTTTTTTLKNQINLSHNNSPLLEYHLARTDSRYATGFIAWCLVCSVLSQLSKFGHILQH